MITLHGWWAIGFVLLMLAPFMIAFFLLGEWVSDRLFACRRDKLQQELAEVTARHEAQNESHPSPPVTP